VKFRDLNPGDRVMLDAGEGPEYAEFVRTGFAGEPIFRSYTSGDDMSYEWAPYRQDDQWYVAAERLRLLEVLSQPKHVRPEGELKPGTVIVQPWFANSGTWTIDRISDELFYNTEIFARNIGVSKYATRVSHRADA
jgi:hypothetical protein